MFKFYIIFLFSISVFTFASSNKDNIENKIIFSSSGIFDIEENHENGIFKSYYSSGKLQLISEYKNGKKNGTFLKYYENGNRRKLNVSFVYSSNTIFCLQSF